MSLSSSRNLRHPGQAFRHGVGLALPGRTVQRVQLGAQHRPAQRAEGIAPELINGSFRRELLNGYLFATLRQVREHCQLWQYDYNHLRPH